MPEDQYSEFEVRFFDPKTIQIFRSTPGDARVRLTWNDTQSWSDVRVSRAFPFSDPDRYIGFRDGDDKDIGMVADPTQLDDVSQQIIAQEMERRYFTPTVQRVVSVLEEHGTVTWEVETDRGARRFVVRGLRDNSFSLGPNRLMMTDTEGNRYEFPDVEAFGPKAYAVLAKVM